MAFFLKRGVLVLVSVALTFSLAAFLNRGFFVVPQIEATSESEEPRCLSLSGYPNRGGAVLTTTFTGAGSTREGKIAAFEFIFGDGEKVTVEKDVGETGTHSLSHAYLQPGTYSAFLRVKDNKGQWSELEDSCRVKIEVEGEILSGVSAQPKTGPEAFLALGFLFSNLTGIAIKRLLI